MCQETRCMPDRLPRQTKQDITDTDARTDEVWIDTPCGLDIHRQNGNICNKIRQSFPACQELITKSVSICECLHQAIGLGGAATVNNIDTSDVSSPTSILLRTFARLSQV